MKSSIFQPMARLPGHQWISHVGNLFLGYFFPRLRYGQEFISLQVPLSKATVTAAVLSKAQLSHLFSRNFSHQCLTGRRETAWGSRGRVQSNCWVGIAEQEWDSADCGVVYSVILNMLWQLAWPVVGTPGKHSFPCHICQCCVDVSDNASVF